MTRRIADMDARADEDGAVLRITIGALRIRLQLSNRARLALARALLGGHGECTADVSVAPLGEITEVSLNARTVEG